MTSTTLTGMYTNSVILGQGSIGDSVTLTGTIAIGYAGGNGIYAGASVSNAYVYNKGSIQAGANGGTLHAGAGIYLGGAGTVNNAGHILGGQAGNYDGGSAPAGGIGVDLHSGGSLQTTSLIEGGFGGNGAYGGSGGAGVYFGGAGEITNQGDILGGDGGSGSQTGGGGDGGVGIELGVGTLSNGGLIVGGQNGYGGGGQAGNGAMLINNAALSNAGTILGGYANALSAGQTGGAGGIGVYADNTNGSHLTNGGLIQGGQGASSQGGTGTAGGIGMFGENIYTLSNTATIRGGAGGAGYDKGGVGGTGGIGLSIDHAFGKVTNSGTLAGGVGGMGYQLGGAGGFGVSIEAGATLVNSGLITGGDGGTTQAPNMRNGDGGAGVYLNGGTLITSGTIGRGLGGGIDASAIVFGKYASTLVIDPGAVFNGEVLANAADTLDLAGTTSGTLSGLGTGFDFQGFKTINVEAGSDWTLVGDNLLSSNEVLNIDGSLAVDGHFTDVGSLKINAAAELQATGSAIISASNLTLAGGLLNCGEQAEFVIGTTTTGAVKGAITLDAGTIFSGYGTIATAVEGSGTLDVTKGVLFIGGVLGPDITASVVSGSTLELYGGGALDTSISGAGTLFLNDTTYTLSASVAIAEIVIDPKTTLSGTGTIMGTLDAVGTVTAAGGKIIVEGTALGEGNFAAASGATLDLAGGIIAGAGALSGAGTIDIAGASTLEAGLKLTASHITDSAAITLGTATALTIGAAEIFAIDAASGSTLTISGAAGDRLSNAGSLVATGPGTADIDVAFVNAKTVSVSSGTLAFLGGVINNGTFATGAGTLSFDKKISGTGTLGIGTGTLSLLSGAVATQSVRFEQSAGRLDLAHPTDFSAPISDFAAQDKIDLLDTKATGFTFAGGTLTLEDGSKTVASLSFTGSYTQNDFAISTDNHSGTLISFK